MDRYGLHEWGRWIFVGWFLCFGLILVTPTQVNAHHCKGKHANDPGCEGPPPGNDDVVVEVVITDGLAISEDGGGPYLGGGQKSVEIRSDGDFFFAPGAGKTGRTILADFSKLIGTGPVREDGTVECKRYSTGEAFYVPAPFFLPQLENFPLSTGMRFWTSHPNCTNLCLNLFEMEHEQTDLVEIGVIFGAMEKNTLYWLAFGVALPQCSGCGLVEVTAFDDGLDGVIDEWQLRTVADSTGKHPAFLHTMGETSSGKPKKGDCDLGTYDMPFEMTITRK